MPVKSLAPRRAGRTRSRSHATRRSPYSPRYRAGRCRPGTSGTRATHRSSSRRGDEAGQAAAEVLVDAERLQLAADDVGAVARPAPRARRARSGRRRRRGARRRRARARAIAGASASSTPRKDGFSTYTQATSSPQRRRQRRDDRAEPAGRVERHDVDRARRGAQTPRSTRRPLRAASTPARAPRERPVHAAGHRDRAGGRRRPVVGRLRRRRPARRARRCRLGNSKIACCLPWSAYVSPQ